MSVNRRQFLEGAAVCAAGGTVAVAAVSEANAIAREGKPRLPDALGLMYDSTLCVGCKACVAGCKAANGMPADVSPDQRDWNTGTWDTPKDLSGKTLNIIKVYRDGTMEQKDSATDGFAFVKRQCLHCVDPSCVSCCPVSAMIKDPDTGVVRNDPERCIGCRYCVFACPFQVPRYEFDSAFGRIRKCELCRHRLAEGQLPGCVEHCPTGATLFGRVTDLREEAHRRLALKPGDRYEYPRGDINGRYGRPTPPHEKVVQVAYRPEVYGENVLGGTQALYLSAVPFDKLGLPHGNVPDHMYAAETEGVQHLLYKGMVAPAVVLAGLAALAYRNVKTHHDEAERTEARAETARATHDHAPVGGKLFTVPVIVLMMLLVPAAVVLAQRFVFGLGSVTNLSDGYPWGMWIAIDLIIGTALACGGLVIALLVYILNRGQYHPIVRAALMTSLFGYVLGAIAVMIDLGRWWQGHNILLPWLWNANSVLLETALCIFVYILVLLVEFAPTVLERFGMTQSRRALYRVLFIFTALGCLLPMMHQSSMGTVVILLGYKLSPLWQSQLLPLNFLLTAFTLGYAVVVFESVLSSASLKRPFETRILAGLCGIMVWVQIVFMVVRYGDVVWRGAWPLAFAGDVRAWFFWLEFLMGAAAAVLLLPKANRTNPRSIFLGACAMLLNGVLYRLNSYLIGYDPGDGWSYFPSAGEILVTLAIFSFEVLMYVLLVKNLPVLHVVKGAPAPR